ncbi:GNAT family N-acetyltransferase [Reinekea blandensis]|uniref:Ribosomal-protein-serine acetyltransferase n=1 Tax=Reinekea blandensis MED297 TaxID=314283 RepID=A4BCF1_9GAMM|nr:GNAT family protein [Reinekea blandensis]EAR10217.1 ribosomal-protein-serine acetyltransferase [Reinekea sp. MED297] [Reinekea blandensis MED297]
MFQLNTSVPDLRLVLAEPRYADALFQLVDRNRSYLRRWLPWLDYNLTSDDSQNFLRNCQANYAAQTQLNTLMFLGDELVGTTGFNHINPINHTAEIGYWLGEDYMGQGLMTAATAKIVEVGFERYHLNRQEIRAMTDNAPSRAVAERLGFTHEGTLRQAAHQYGEYFDLENYSLLKSEWQAK